MAATLGRVRRRRPLREDRQQRDFGRLARYWSPKVHYSEMDPGPRFILARRAAARLAGRSPHQTRSWAKNRPVTWVCVDECDPLGATCSWRWSWSSVVEATGLVLSCETFRDHRNPPVQLEHLDLTGRGLPLLKGHGSSQIDRPQSRSNHHHRPPGQFGGFPRRCALGFGLHHVCEPRSTRAPRSARRSPSPGRRRPGGVSSSGMVCPGPNTPPSCMRRTNASWRGPARLTSDVPRSSPPGRSTRAVSAIAAGGSGKQWRPV